MTSAAAPATEHDDNVERDDELVFLTTQDVIEKTGLSSTTLQRRRGSDPAFPKPVVLSWIGNRPRSIRWVKSEIEEWMRRQLDGRPD